MALLVKRNTRLIILTSLLYFLISMALPGADTNRVVVDDFGSNAWQQHWKFSNGPEFPGSEGALAPTSGQNGHAAADLKFKFSCAATKKCGLYVSATQKLAQPLDTSGPAAFELSAAVPPNARILVQVKDQSGQTLQYAPIVSSLEEANSPSWRKLVFPLWQKPENHFGGSNSGAISGAISEASIVVVNRFGKATEGDAKFDHLSVFHLQPQTIQIGAASPKLIAPILAGELAPRFGVNVHNFKDSVSLDIAKQTGFTFARADIHWKEVEVNGNYVFTQFDAFVAEMRKRHMGVLWVLDYGHPAHGGGHPQSQADADAYGRCAAAVVSHFNAPDIRFELWNEPDGNSFGSEAAYAMTLRAALQNIRQGSPQAQVSTGGVWLSRLNFSDALLESGAAAEATAYAVHPYRNKPELVIGELSILRDLIKEKLGKVIPVWDTEWGYSSHLGQWGGTKEEDGHSDEARRRQALLASRECLSAWIAGFPLIVWYELKDDNTNPTDEEGNYGMLTASSVPKPAAASIGALMTMAKNRRYTGLIPDLPFGVHAMCLQGTNDVTYAIWSEESKVTNNVQLATAKLISVTDVMGHAVQPNGGSLPLREDMGPIYVRYEK